MQLDNPNSQFDDRKNYEEEKDERKD